VWLERMDGPELPGDHRASIGDTQMSELLNLPGAEERLDLNQFVRLGRGTLINIDAIVKVNVMPGGTHLALLSNGQRVPVSRLQSRAISERLLKL
jgi:DNA-binding LytR/AlgR family response regulator